MVQIKLYGGLNQEAFMDYTAFFNAPLQKIKEEGRYRFFADLERIAGAFPYAWHRTDHGAEKVIVWCSNDYLSMGEHPAVLNAMRQAITRCGAGAGGTRNIGGTNRYHVMLEDKLAHLHKKDRALLFSSGYIANEAALSTLAHYMTNGIVFSDEYNHASMIYGIKYGGTEKRVFRHNNMKDLENQLKIVDINRPKIIVFESLYSMDGDFAPISDICDLATKYNALTYIDEVHAIGIYGAHGAGLVEQHGEEDRITMICSNFGKAVGVMGGYITANDPFIDFIRSFAPPFIFTTALPPAVAAGALASINHFSIHTHERDNLWHAVNTLKPALRQAGFTFFDDGGHIIPLIIGDATLCRQITDRLLTLHKIYVQPINFPTVPKGTERLRITPSASHTPEMIQTFVSALIEVWSHFGLNHKKMTA